MTPTGALLVIAVPAAVIGAAAMGLANATQSKATRQVPTSGILDPHLILHLLRNKVWLVGMLATLTGLGLQVVALGFGPLILVQPLLVTSLLFTNSFIAWMVRRRTDKVLAGGGLLCVAGLAAFLLVAKPQQQSDRIASGAALLPLAITFGVLVVGCVVLAFRTNRSVRVLALALATGILYGVTAGLMKIVSGQFRLGLAVPFQHWALYTVCLIGPMGFLLSQNTFQQGKLITTAVAVITTVDPLVGIGIGVNWFGESVSTSPAALVGEIVAALMIIGGIIVLAHRGEHLKRQAALPEQELGSDHNHHGPGGLAYSGGRG